MSYALRDGERHDDMTQQDSDEQLRALLVAANDVVDYFGIFWRRFRAFRRVPVSLEVSILGLQRGTDMSFQMPDDHTTTATLQFRDVQGGLTPNAPGPVTWSVSDPALASVTPAADGLTAQVASLPGVTSGTFDVAASSGNLAGTSEPIDIVPGAPVAAGITLQLNQTASEQEARSVHEGRQTVTAGE